MTPALEQGAVPRVTGAPRRQLDRARDGRIAALFPRIERMIDSHATWGGPELDNADRDKYWRGPAPPGLLLLSRPPTTRRAARRSTRGRVRRQPAVGDFPPLRRQSGEDGRKWGTRSRPCRGARGGFATGSRPRCPMARNATAPVKEEFREGTSHLQEVGQAAVLLTGRQASGSRISRAGGAADGRRDFSLLLNGGTWRSRGA